MSISSYYNREYRGIELIDKHKYSINKFFASNCETLEDDKILIVDSFEEITRNTLKKIGVKDDRIITIDLECIKPDNLRIKKLLKTYCEETDLTFKYIFADVINTPKEAVRQIKPLFDRKKILKGGVLALTVCTRGVTSQQFGRLNPLLITLASVNNYTLLPLDVPSNLQLICNSNSKYKIRGNMTDNAAYQQTGRTITVFFWVL